MEAASWAVCTKVHTDHDTSPQDHSQPQPTHPGRTPHAVGHGLILLMKSIMMPETCWDRSLITNIELVASCWFPSLRPIFTMHGHEKLKRTDFISSVVHAVCRLCQTLDQAVEGCRCMTHTSHAPFAATVIARSVIYRRLCGMLWMTPHFRVDLYKPCRLHMCTYILTLWSLTTL